MIKKIFHILFAIIFCAAFTALVIAAFYFAYMHFYRINIINMKTYHNIVKYWDSGATLKSNDLLMLFGIFCIVPINLVGWWVIYHMKYANLWFGPLSWIAGLDTKNYETPDITIKNLKVEEKKTIEQIVNERLEQEKKKTPNLEVGRFRQDIIEQIEQNSK
jgi:hypothetical protein